MSAETLKSRLARQKSLHKSWTLLTGLWFRMQRTVKRLLSGTKRTRKTHGKANMFPPEPIPARPLTIAQGIALVEGWYAHGAVANRPQRNNNPGNLEYHSWMTERYGAVLETAEAPRFANFPNPDMGWMALTDLLDTPSYRCLTVKQAVNRFAPPVENNDTMYVDSVCRFTGKQPDDLIREDA